jgi:hypothetical protein
MAIKIKRSTGDLAPASLAAGQLAYTEGSTNGGTLYYGEIGGTVREIAGRKFVDKLNGIAAGAEVNTVDSVNGQTGAVVLAVGDISGAESTLNRGVANGYASLDSSGLVPSSQLPSYVDDVVEGANLAAFPATGESNKIYVAVDTGKTYRWSGSTYVEISASPGSTDAVTEGSTNLYYTNARARAAISATQNLTYDSATGVITGPDLSGYAVSSSLATVATSGSYADLSNKPSLFSGSYTDLTDKPSLFSGAYEDLSGKPTLFSGSYTDLTDKPALFSGAYADLSGKPDLTVYQLAANAFSGSYTDLTDKPSIPENTSDLNNDEGFITEVVEDTTPQLGGDLDLNGKKLVTVSNGGITLAPNGSGSILLNEAGTAFVLARRTFSTGTGASSLIVQRNFTGGTLSTMDGHVSAVGFSQRDSAAVQSIYARVAANYYTDGAHTMAMDISTNNFSTSKRVFEAAEEGILVGDGSAGDEKFISTPGAQNLVLNTNSGATDATVGIEAGANGNIRLIPDGTGHVIIGELSFPNADGTADQVLKTDGAGNLSWVTQSSGVTTFVALTDTPSSFSGSAGYYVKVNSGATALEFSQDVDDGTF